MWGSSSKWAGRFAGLLSNQPSLDWEERGGAALDSATFTARQEEFCEP